MPAQEIPPPAAYGQIIEEVLHIVDIRIGSRDADRSGNAEYVAPAGFRILGHQISRSGHHSGVAHLKTIQPGRIAYESSAMANLRDALRSGFLGGTLFAPSDEDARESPRTNSEDQGASVSATVSYANFLKEFDARYLFVANTHASISFSWFVDSESFDHGARLVASATIRLQRAATAEQAERAAELIRFALESKERVEVFDIIDSALAVPAPS